MPVAETEVAEPEVAEPVIAAPPPAPEVEEKDQDKRSDKQPKRQPRYHVILWNDEDHSFEFVIVMLLDLFGHPPEKGYELALEVDQQGRAIVLTTTLEHAELKRDQIKGYLGGAIRDSSVGTMNASIEPEPA